MSLQTVTPTCKIDIIILYVHYMSSKLQGILTKQPRNLKLVNLRKRKNNTRIGRSTKVGHEKKDLDMILLKSILNWQVVAKGKGSGQLGRI